MNEPDELSVLDYFAAAALTGILSANEDDDDDEPSPIHIAQRAYAAAKWMMSERAKRDENGIPVTVGATQ